MQKPMNTAPLGGKRLTPVGIGPALLDKYLSSIVLKISGITYLKTLQCFDHTQGVWQPVQAYFDKTIETHLLQHHQFVLVRFLNHDKISASWSRSGSSTTSCALELLHWYLYVHVHSCTKHGFSFLSVVGSVSIFQRVVPSHKILVIRMRVWGKHFCFTFTTKSENI